METDKSRGKQIYKTTIIGSLVNAFLLIIKFVAGVLGNSQAMIADAIHSLSDFITDIVVLVFVKISNKPKDNDHHYGHGKFETLATSIIGLILVGVAVGICWSGIERIISVYHGETLQKPGIITLVVAVISLISKEILFQWTFRVGKKVNSSAVVANAWHHRSDAFSSIATTLGIAGAIFLGEKWRILDPIAAILVSFFIIKVAFKLLKTSLDELLEKSLSSEVEEEILALIGLFPGVHNPHNLRTRCVGNNYAIEVDIRVNRNLTIVEAHDIATRLEKKIREKYGQNTHIITHIEPLKE